MKARVIVKLKDSVLDPQGQAIKQLLGQRGYKNINEVRVGKFVDFELEGVDSTAGTAILSEIADKLLANPIIESYRVEAL